MHRPPNATPPIFEKPPVGGNFVDGGDAHFECKIRGNPTPEVVWSRRGMPIKNDQKRQVSYNPDTGVCFLHISKITAEDDGDYTCTAVNCAGESSLTVKIQRGMGGPQYQQQLHQQGAFHKRTYQTRTEQRLQTSFDRTMSSSDTEGEPGSPLYYGVPVGFRVDTFEYRLLREEEFRKSLIVRRHGEPIPALDRSRPPSAPQLLQRPRNSKLVEGADATFQVQIGGNPQPQITWFKNGQVLVQTQRCTTFVKETVATLQIRYICAEDAGYYTMLAENTSGRVACSAHLVIEAKPTGVQRLESLETQPKMVTSPPATVTTDYEVDSATTRTLKPSFVKCPSDKEVTEGKMIRFDCRVSGRPCPDVLWFHNEKQIVNDNTHKLLVNEGGVHSLMITAASKEDAGTYICIAKNKSGEMRSDFNLTVIEKEQVVPPKFVERFQSIHVKEGESVTLHCRAVGTPVPRITWQKDGVQIHSQPPNIIIETQGGSSTLNFNQVTAKDSAWYHCTAQNQAGSSSTRGRLHVSSEALPPGQDRRLNLPRPSKVIHPAPAPARETIWLRHVEPAAPQMPPEEEERPPQKPSFHTHLQDLHLQEGDRANFDARLLPVGDPTMQVEWFVNGKPVEASSRVITTCTFGYVALTLIHIHSEDSGVYMCKATNEAGEAVTTATLHVSPRPVIERSTQQPESWDAIQDLEDWDRYKREESVEETISVSKPVFVKPLNNLENLREGGFAHFEAQLTPVNDPTMKVEWLFNGEPLQAGSRVSTTFSFGYVALNIKHLRAEDAGVYVCRATNQKGQAVSTATLKVRVSGEIITDLGFPEQQQYQQRIQELESWQQQQQQVYEVEEAVPQQTPTFFSQLKDLLNIPEGKVAHFEARIEPSGDSTMRIEWLKDDKPLEASSRTSTFFNFGYVSLTIRGIDSRDSGTYTCVATNSKGSAFSAARLTCIEKKSVVLESQYPEGLEKIQHLEDTSRYQRDVEEETTVTQRPVFVDALKGKDRVIEGQSAHFETRLEPLGDLTMTVEWFFNGKPLTTGHRFKTYFDFGYVALDILYTFPEDSGSFTVKARNALGEAVQSKSIFVQAKSAVDTSTMHEMGLEQIAQLEEPPHQEPYYMIEEITKSKPIFTHPLHDPKPLREGERLHLECRLEPANDPTMKVEWFFNGKPLKTGSRIQTLYEFGFISLDLLTANAEDTGEFTVRATNHLGSSHTSSLVKVVGKSAVISDTMFPEGLQKIRQLEDTSRYQKSVQEETIITQKPTFTKSLRNIDTVEGNNIHLECKLLPIGDPTMKVEWFVNNVPIKIGHRFRPAHEFDYVALDILGVYPEDSGVYTCKATSSKGEAVVTCTVKCIAKSELILESQQPSSLEKIQHLEDTSRYQRDAWVEEIAKIKPRFTSTLNSQHLREGQQAHFECHIEPVSDSTLKIEWFHNGKILPSGHRYRPFHDFGYVALNILSVKPEDEGTYTCRATNAMGSVELQATLACEGKSAILSDTHHPEGLQKIQELEAYSKRRVRGDLIEFITQAPVFTSPPQNLEVREGQSARFECRLIPVGDPKLKVQWFHNGKQIKMGTHVTENFEFGHVALVILYAYPEDSGTYTCKATNALGEAVTSVNLKCTGKSALILESQQPDSLEKIRELEDESRLRRPEYPEETTTQPPVFTQPMKNLVLQENESAHFDCRLIPVKDNKLKVEWFFNGMPLMQASRVTTLHDFGYVSLDLAYVKPEDSGTYTCKATSELGQAVCSATLNVRGVKALQLQSQQPDSLQKIQMLEDASRYQREVAEDVVVTSKPIFITSLQGVDKLIEGQNSHMECRIEPYPDPSMKIEWFFNGKVLPSAHRYRTMYDFGLAALDILSVTPEDTGEYTIKATNRLGVETSSTKIHVTGRSALILESQQPDSLQRIKELEDESRFLRTTEEEVLYNQRPEFSRPLYNLDDLVEGQPAHLEAMFTPVNDPNLKVEWFVNGRTIPQAHRFRSICDFGYVSLDILYVFPEDTGTYMCKATNKAGEAITTCSINVKAKSAILTDTLHEEGLQKIRELESAYTPPAEEPPPPVTRPVFLTPLKSLDNVVEGQSAHLECQLEPITDPKLKVMWFVNGVEIKEAHRFRKTHDFGYVALDILYVFPEDTGTYMCKAVNELGEAVTTCSIKVQARRSILDDTQHPEGLEKIRELESLVKFQPIEIVEKPLCRPYFTTELQGVTELVEGQSAHFECRVEPAHDTELKVEIFHNGKLLDAGSRFHVTFDFGYVALDIRHVYPEDTGMFTVKATNRLGEAAISINIKVHGKSAIILDTHHPEGLAKIKELEDESRYRREEVIEPHTFQRPVFTAPLQNLDTLIEGDAAHLECRLIPVGDPTLKVEWYINEKALPTSSRFLTTHDFGYVALDVQYVRPDDAGVYMCRASNELGEAVTTASVKIKTKAAIQLETQHPEGLEKIQEMEYLKSLKGPEEPDRVYDKPVFIMPIVGPHELVEGQLAFFECRVTPTDDPDLKFEWYLNGKELKTGTRFRVTHDFGLVNMEIKSVIPEDSGVYMCKAINKAGEAVTSTSLKVTGRHGVLGESQHPECHLKTQQMFEFDSSRIPEVWWDAGPTSRPVFTQHLSSYDKLVEGQNVRLEARVEPATDEKLKIEWYKNGVSLVTGTRMAMTFDFGLCALELTGIRPDDSGIYTCRAVNEAGEAVSTCSLKIEGRHGIILTTQNPESLQKIQELEAYQAPEADLSDTVYESPVFITHLNNLELREDDSAYFECRVEPSKDPTLNIEFFVNGKPLSAATRFTANNDFGFVTLNVSHVYPEDSGIYTCRATNSKGQAVTTGSLKVHGKGAVISTTLHPMGQEGLSRVQEVEEAYLSRYQTTLEEDELMFPKPVFVEPLQQNFSVNEGDGLRLNCRYEPSTDPKLTIDWFFNGKVLELGSRFTHATDFGQVTLVISDLWPRDNGVYTCRAHNAAGEAFTSTTIQCIGKSTIYEGTLHPEGERGLESIQTLEESLLKTVEGIPDEEGHPPIFTSQFQNLTNLNEGDIAHFEATLTPAGDQTMAVEWFFNGKPLKARHRIRTIHAFGMVVLEIMGVVVEDSGQYTCRATNKWGKAEITVTLETVDRARGQRPQFTTQLKSMVGLKEGASGHFECTLVPVGDPAMKVEWFHNGQPLRDSSRIKTLSDFGYVVMDISFVHVEDSGEYICVATNKYGSDTTRCVVECTGHGKIFRDSLQPQSLQKIAALEGYSHYQSQVSTELTVNQPPKFETQIQPLTTLVEGQSAHFETQVSPINDPNLKVEWFFNGKPLQHDEKSKHGKNILLGTRIRSINDFGFVVLEISPVYPEDSGVYSCRATNKIGEAVTTCTMKCEGKRGIILESQLPEGMESGIEKIAKFEEIPSGHLAEVWMDTETTQAPKFITTLQDITIGENSLVHFECRLTPVGDPTMKVDWYHNGKILKTGSRVRTISDFGYVILEIAGVYQRDVGVYTCKAVNRMGEATISANLKVKGKASIVMEPQLPKSFQSGTESLKQLEESLYQTQEITLDEEKQQPPNFITEIQNLLEKIEGDSAHFECRLQPVGDPTMRVEWYLNGRPLVTGSRVHTVDDFGFVVLDIDWLFPRDSGEYVCCAMNKWGKATTKATLKVKSKRDIIIDSQLPMGMTADKLRELEYPLQREALEEEVSLLPPRFITQIQSLENLNEGDSAHFECRVEPVNDPNLRIEWFCNGQPLRSGHKFKVTHDFGFVALDVLYVHPEDCGEYTARAFSPLGEDFTRAILKCKGKPSLIYKSQLPKQLEGGVKKIAEMEAAWQRVEEIEETSQEKQAPMFVMKPEPQNVLEGDWAKFQCRVTGNPKPRLMWVVNGQTIVTGSRYKLTYDGIFHLDIPKVRQYDQGKVEVYARNLLGEAYCWTTLEVRPRRDDYRAVLKHSPRPWYDSEVKTYQQYRHETELQRVFEEKLTPGGTKVDVWQTQEAEAGERMQIKQRLEEEDIKKLQPEVKRYKTDAIYVDSVTGEKRVEEQSQVSHMAKSYREKVEQQNLPSPTSPESIVHGKEVHVARQKQTQYETKGDLDITRHTTLTETMEQEHMGKTKERRIVGEVPKTISPVFTKKIQPCRAYEGESAKFECLFTGVPAPTITWYRENFPITPSDDFQVVSRPNMSILVIREVYVEDSGMFTVKAENRGGSAKSSANLLVEEKREHRSGKIPPSFIKTIQGSAVQAGQLVRLDARLSGSKPVDVYWLKNGTKLVPDATHKTLEEGDMYTLMLLETTAEHSGMYECVAINQAGEARCQTQVLVESKSPQATPTSPKVLTQEARAPEIVKPLKDAVVKEGQPAVFTCKILGSPAPRGKWFKGDAQVKQSRYFRMSVEKDIYTLRISEAFPEDEGIYKFVATNPNGTVTTSASLKVKDGSRLRILFLDYPPDIYGRPGGVYL
ncbi:titin-like [Limulus polyphemus]|uniref:Titin-like n=1 Tax=Limulus polyphemus TaxID=6850 RepID=A0ABM1SI16_LIMPO|nr:titin-like [Limulus polyphemus]